MAYLALAAFELFSLLSVDVILSLLEGIQVADCLRVGLVAFDCSSSHFFNCSLFAGLDQRHTLMEFIFFIFQTKCHIICVQRSIDYSLTKEQ